MAKARYFKSYDFNPTEKYVVSQNTDITDHADETQEGSIAYLVSNIGTVNKSSIELLGNKIYYIKQDLTIPENIVLEFKKGAIIESIQLDLIDSYTWYESGSGTSEYYLQSEGGGDPGVSEPAYLFENGVRMNKQNNAGSLSQGEWAWANNDLLGYNTVYVRLSDDSDPDSKSNAYIEKSYLLDINGKVVSGQFEIYGDNIKVIGGQVLTKSSSYTLTRGEIVHVDTFEDSITLWCPSNPHDGDRIGIRDKASTFGINTITLVGNGRKILGDSTFTFDVTDRPADFEFNEDRNEWIFAGR